MRLPAAYARVVFPTPGLPSRRGFMGRSWSLTTIQAARSCRMSSSCPTHCTASSSGWARCSLTPSISTVIGYPSLWGAARPRSGSTGSDTAEHDPMHLYEQFHFLEGKLQHGGD